MIKRPCARLILCSLLFATGSHADVVIHSPAGTTLTFSQKKTGEHYGSDAWGKILFSSRGTQADLTQEERYYSEDGSSHVSPSGRYLVVNSVSGGDLVQEDGSVTYTDRAYCSVVDMHNGCITSDWSGEACGYSWVGDQDRLASSARPDAEAFNFTSMRPTIKAVKTDFAVINTHQVMNILRCDAPAKNNVSDYQQLAKTNKALTGLINGHLLPFLNRIHDVSTVGTRAVLFTDAADNSKTRAYLVAGDRVKVIQRSSDRQWVNIGYVNAKGVPLIAWVKAQTLD